MKVKKRTSKLSVKEVSPNSLFAQVVKVAYSQRMGNEFYTASNIADKHILEIKDDGSVFKAIRNEYDAKIIARIDNTVYNFPAIIAAPGSKAKLAEAYAELRMRETQVSLIE